MKTLIIDPYARAFYGDENSNTEAKFWTERMDVLKREAGLKTLIVMAHTGRADMGEGFEHVRGATRLDDWADQRWVLTRGATRETVHMRFIRAEGRSVQLEQTMLVFDPDTLRLEVSNFAGPRAVQEELEEGRRILQFMRNSGYLDTTTRISKSALEAQLGGNARSTRNKVQALISTQEILVETEGRTQYLYVAPMIPNDNGGISI